MRFLSERKMPVVVVGLMLIALGGCGVKSSPAEPEDSTYPLIYPAGADEEDEEKGKRVDRSPRYPTGGYQPPPPATQLPK